MSRPGCVLTEGIVRRRVPDAWTVELANGHVVFARPPRGGEGVREGDLVRLEVAVANPVKGYILERLVEK